MALLYKFQIPIYIYILYIYIYICVCVCVCVCVYTCDRVQRDARWIGGLSHKSSDLANLCNLLQKVVLSAFSNTGFEGMQIVNYPAN